MATGGAVITHNFNPLYAKLNPISHLLLLFRSHHIIHVSRLTTRASHSILKYAQKIKGKGHPKTDHEGPEGK